jgi:hypothetical protein
VSAARRREQGQVSGMLVLVLLGLCAGGAWNYGRNLQAEQVDRAARPLSGYATGDLEALADAYQQEIAAARTQVARADHEAALRDVEAELSKRGGATREWEIHLRRLTAF